MAIDGKPTRPDVDLLLKTFSFNEHDIIRHEQIEAVIEHDWRSNRYRTIMKALTKRIKADRNQTLEALSSVGFKVLSQGERLESNAKKSNQEHKRMGRTYRDTGMIPNSELSPEQQIRRDSLQKTQLAMLKAGKELKSLPPPPKPVAPVTHIGVKKLERK